MPSLLIFHKSTLFEAVYDYGVAYQRWQCETSRKHTAGRTITDDRSLGQLFQDVFVLDRFTCEEYEAMNVEVRSARLF